MKKIKLTQGQFALVDDQDFDWLNQWSWQARFSRDTNSFYVLRGEYIERKNGKRIQQTILMHRAILEMPTGEFVDHINHDTLDNRHENLRLVTATQNNQNKRMQKNNTSGYKGVSWNKERRKWSAYIRTNGSIKFLGYFAVLREAAHAYNNAAKSIFGEFACINKLTLTL